ncbi:DUF2760 domain-containing protein [Burkholderia glumae]|uniref:DUF2760 domain-containing protein n=1 Tax=Burkholderia glumae TaxID=337 RepID=UPI000F5FE242|nr:DUF2760 domain-containing protein [Burkholderia glumae]QJP69980.1 DUF2760 domain-containing protein [Burkholderia glumae]QJW82301.1 DUF2760 domain-containing protein [Burkholderia glumae]RQZ71851.1 DUF2760 domain-containing protein [Burkholderia glumae]UVS87982.1 DUF2760 domain-containing protein [Burkholderia glumae]
MPESNLSFVGRLSVAIGSFFAILGDGKLAAEVRSLRNGARAPAAPAAPPPAPAPTPAAAPAPAVQAANPEAALQLLGLLQKNARFIDFVEEDIASYADAEIGAAARLVHEGCRATLREHFTIRPVRTEPEGTRVTLAAGFDASAHRVTGNVVGSAPFTGTLSHRGWRAAEVKLPQRVGTHDPSVIAPAEVEL